MVAGTFERRPMISVDATGYGGSDDRRQSAIQRDLLAVLDEAAVRAGLDRSGWERQAAGDGEFAVLLPGVAEERLVDEFPRYLAAFLHRRNGDAPRERRLRLRLAIHYGTAIQDVNGRSGQGPVAVARLCDSPPLRAALEESGADLVVILSDRVFEDLVRNGHTLTVAPEDFREVRVRVKEFDERAWICVPRGRNVHDLELRIPPASVERNSVERNSARTDRNGPSVHNEFHGQVDARDANFGFSS